MSDGFLARWARRKVAARVAEQDGRDAAPETPIPEIPTLETSPPEGAPIPDALPRAAEETAPPAGSDTAAERAEAAEPLPELPSIDALTPESDLTPFLRAGVPSALRNAALRRMWSLDPAIRDFVSEAREYAYDWNSPGGVPGLGPLLPSDDVQAMLRRIVGGAPGDRPGENPAPAGAAPDGALRAEFPDDPPEPRQDEAGRDRSGHDESRDDEAGQAAGAGAPEMTEATPLLAGESPPDGAVRLPAPDGTAPVPAAAPPESGRRPAPSARLRRHGGAMPA